MTIPRVVVNPRAVANTRARAMTNTRVMAIPGTVANPRVMANPRGMANPCAMTNPRSIYQRLWRASPFATTNRTKERNEQKHVCIFCVLLSTRLSTRRHANSGR